MSSVLMEVVSSASKPARRAPWVGGSSGTIPFVAQPEAVRWASTGYGRDSPPVVGSPAVLAKMTALPSAAAWAKLFEVRALAPCLSIGEACS